MNATTQPCAACNQPHPWTEQRGYYHPDGHPWTPPPQPAPPATSDHGWRPVFVGLFAACPTCAALVENTRTAIDQHERSHT